MPRIYLIRHGQTLFNLMYRTQGYSDSLLTDKGIKMAKALGKYFKDQNIEFDHGFSSTSERAEDTLNYITSNEVPYTRFKGLKEINFGLLEGGSDKEIWNKYDDLSFENFNEHFKEFNVESLADGSERFNSVMLDIANKDFNNVIVVSHGMIIALWINMLGEEFIKEYLKLKKGKDVFMDNCDCLVIDYDNNSFKPKEFIAFREIEGVKIND